MLRQVEAPISIPLPESPPLQVPREVRISRLLTNPLEYINQRFSPQRLRHSRGRGSGRGLSRLYSRGKCGRCEECRMGIGLSNGQCKVRILGLSLPYFIFPIIKLGG